MMLRVRPAWPVVAVGAFVVLAVLTVGGWPPLERCDAAVSAWFRRYGTARPDVIAAVRVATDVAATIPFLVAGVALATLLAVRRRRPAAVFCAAVTVGVPALWALMHLVLPRPRPQDGFVAVASHGFPSGHTSNAAAAAVVAILLLWPRLRPAARIAVLVSAVAFAALVGLSRVVLLAHWPSDVLGGWLLAVAVVPLLAGAAERGAGLPSAATPGSLTLGRHALSRDRVPER